MSDSTDPNAERHGIVLSQRQYDLLKDLALIALPGVSVVAGTGLTLYEVDAKVSTLVIGTIGLVIATLGILLKISNVQYQADAKVRAAKVANFIAPEVTVSPDDATKVEIKETATGPGFGADPAAVTVSPPSQ